MEYIFDVFLSYSRKGEWPRFVGRLFKPMLVHWLGAELGRVPAIFHDEEGIEIGQRWPERLADALSSSRVMVALWSKEYFSSDWCTAELGQILARAESIRAGGPTPQLVLAAVIHNGEEFPAAVQDIQRLEICRHANPWIYPESEKAAELSELVRRFSVDVARAIRAAPACDPAWRKIVADGLAKEFKTRNVEQRSLPTLGLAK